ncbi:MAG: hypothetical protein PHN84_10805 [Desulfuromonadaceae bacterium]|nr:hypothetical protein [Desulfuromonadaceae bacterium]
MNMKRFIAMMMVSALFGLFAAPLMAADDAAGVLPATMDKYKSVRDKVAALTGTETARLAPEVVAEAEKSVAAAQEGLKSGSDKATHEAVEKALLQIEYAKVLALERTEEAKTAAVKEELKKAEQRLNDILSGKGE